MSSQFGFGGNFNPGFIPEFFPRIEIEGGGRSTPNIPARGTLEHVQYLQNQLRMLRDYSESEPYRNLQRALVLARLSYELHQGNITGIDGVNNYLSGEIKDQEGNDIAISDLFSEDELDFMENASIETAQDLMDFLDDYNERLVNQENMARLSGILEESGVYVNLSTGIATGGDPEEIARRLGMEYQRPPSIIQFGMTSDRWLGGPGISQFTQNYTENPDGSRTVTLADGNTVTTQSGLVVESSFPTGYQGPSGTFSAGQTGVASTDFGAGATTFQQFGPNPYMAGHGNPDPRARLGPMISSGRLTPAESIALGMTQDLRPETLDAARQEATERFFDLSDPTEMKQIMTFAAMYGFDYATILDSFVNHNTYYFPDK